MYPNNSSGRYYTGAHRASLYGSSSGSGLGSSSSGSSRLCGSGSGSSIGTTIGSIRRYSADLDLDSTTSGLSATRRNSADKDLDTSSSSRAGYPLMTSRSSTDVPSGRSKPVQLDSGKLSAISDILRNLIKIDTQERIDTTRQMIKEQFMREKLDLEQRMASKSKSNDSDGRKTEPETKQRQRRQSRFLRRPGLADTIIHEEEAEPEPEPDDPAPTIGELDKSPSIDQGGFETTESDKEIVQKSDADQGMLGKSGSDQGILEKLESGQEILRKPEVEQELLTSDKEIIQKSTAGQESLQKSPSADQGFESGLDLSESDSILENSDADDGNPLKAIPEVTSGHQKNEDRPSLVNSPSEHIETSFTFASCLEHSHAKPVHLKLPLQISDHVQINLMACIDEPPPIIDTELIDFDGLEMLIIENDQNLITVIEPQDNAGIIDQGVMEKIDNQVMEDQKDDRSMDIDQAQIADQDKIQMKELVNVDQQKQDSLSPKSVLAKDFGGKSEESKLIIQPVTQSNLETSSKSKSPLPRVPESKDKAPVKKDAQIKKEPGPKSLKKEPSPRPIARKEPSTKPENRKESEIKKEPEKRKEPAASKEPSPKTEPIIQMQTCQKPAVPKAVAKTKTQPKPTESHVQKTMAIRKAQKLTVADASVVCRDRPVSTKLQVKPEQKIVSSKISEKRQPKIEEKTKLVPEAVRKKSLTPQIPEDKGYEKPWRIFPRVEEKLKPTPEPTQKTRPGSDEKCKTEPKRQGISKPVDSKSKAKQQIPAITKPLLDSEAKKGASTKPDGLELAKRRIQSQSPFPRQGRIRQKPVDLSANWAAGPSANLHITPTRPASVSPRPKFGDKQVEKTRFITRKSPVRLVYTSQEPTEGSGVKLRPSAAVKQCKPIKTEPLTVKLRPIQQGNLSRSFTVDVGLLMRTSGNNQNGTTSKKWKPHWRREEEGEEEEAEAEEAPSQSEAVEEVAEEPKEEEKPKPKPPPPRPVEDQGGSTKTEAELAMLAQKRKHEEEEEAKLAHYEEQRRIQREKEEEELRLLKEKQERRKREREEEDRIMAERKAAEEERRRQEDEDRKAKAEADRLKKEEEKRKRQQLMAGLQASGGPNFEIMKKDKQAEKFDKFGNIVKAKAEMGLTKEQQDDQKKKALGDLLKPLDTAGLDVNGLRSKIKELHTRIARLEGEKYDMEKRRDRQEYDLKELNERQRQISRNKALKKGLNPDEVANSPHPPKVALVSKYDRQIDRRTYKERRALYNLPPKPKKGAIHHGSARPPSDWGRKENEELENLRKNMEPPKYQEAVKIEGARAPMQPIPTSIEGETGGEQEDE